MFPPYFAKRFADSHPIPLVEPPMKIFLLLNDKLIFFKMTLLISL
jgi:hypothetical protein